MPYVSPEQIAKAKEMDLLTYLQNYEPNELVRFSKDTYTTKTHDSLKINNGMWHWWSRGIGGKTALDYLIHVQNYEFTEAVLKLNGDMNFKKPTAIYSKKKEKVKKQLLLPKRNSNSNVVKSYLLKRGIDEEIIDYCIAKGLIFESLPNHNVIFLGLDNENQPKYASFRGTGKTRFIGDASGSDKAYSFRLVSKNNNKSVHIFESAIDLLSYATILKMQNKDWKSENLLSLSGIYQPAKVITDSKVPITLSKYLDENHSVKRVVFHLDNDYSGRLSTNAISLVLDKSYEIIDNPAPKGKDINDYLCILKGLEITKKSNLAR